MTKDELIKVKKLLEAIIKKEIQAATKPLLKEINTLQLALDEQRSLFGQIIMEQMKRPRLNEQEDEDAYYQPTTVRKNVYAQSNKKGGSPLYDILAETAALSQEELEGVSSNSILDIPREQLEAAGSPGAQLMSKVLDPEKLKRTLKHVMKPQGGVINPIDV